MAKKPTPAEVVSKVELKESHWVTYPLSEYNTIRKVTTSAVGQGADQKTVVEVGPSLLDSGWVQNINSFLELTDTGNGYDISFTNSDKKITLDYCEAADLLLALKCIDDLKYAEVIIKTPE